ncbi:hypothetical protein [Candidatus Dactylopiibacterium carminicum]|uniref:hypothetical protein n=1 Tax=Candidatus Dactylopiibacterium carminicum TaxID=857335 RepID=UPI001482680A|nr:hypothetical protein [Candidatus Dactylopiibacterium carminicum]
MSQQQQSLCRTFRGSSLHEEYPEARSRNEAPAGKTMAIEVSFTKQAKACSKVLS